MSNDRKPARPSSVDSMIESLGHWFLTPVEASTPEHLLDDMLTRITGELVLRTSADDEATSPVTRPWISEEAATGPTGTETYVNEVRRAVLAELLSFKHDELTALKHALTPRRRFQYLTLSSLTALTEWVPINQMRPAYRMLMKEANSECKAVLEMARSETRMSRGESSWVINLKRYEEAHSFHEQFGNHEHAPTAATPERTAPSFTSHRHGTAPADSDFVLILVDQRASHPDAGPGSAAGRGGDDTRDTHVTHPERLVTIMEVVREVLDIDDDDIDPDASFMELGGDSLSSVEVSVLAAQRGLKLSYAQILGAPSIAQWAEAAEVIEVPGTEETESPSSRVSRFVTRSTAQPPPISTLIVAEGGLESGDLLPPAGASGNLRAEKPLMADLIASLIR